jgi:molecular chaperone DnaJ
VEENYQMRLSGEGEAGIYGGSKGDVYLNFNIELHKFFVRRHSDILYELPLNFAQAALGCEIEVPTVDGNTMLKVPQGTQNSKVFRIRGKGVPRLNSGGRGDQLVIVRVVTPQSLSKEQRQLFEDLAKMLPQADMPKDKDHAERIKSLFGEN